ncbi:hypothetical protein DFH28DRAFT_1187427, partial [Melampsora americana]
MGFRESKNKLGARARCAFDRLKHSKSRIALSKLINGEISMIRATSPMPLPVLTLPSSISHRLAASGIFEGMMRESIMFLEVSLTKCLKSPSDYVYHQPRSLNLIKCQEDEASNQSSAQVSEMDGSTTPNKVLEREGRLESPINLRLGSLIKSSAELDMPKPSAFTPLVHPGLSHSQQSAPFTPELTKNPTELTPECTTSITTPEGDECISKTPSLVKRPPSRASSPSSVYSQDSYTLPSKKGKEDWKTPENGVCGTMKMNVSPVRQFLRRRGPIPSSQPLSCKLLQSIMSSKPDGSLSVGSTFNSSDSDSELGDYLEQLCPGGAPMDQYILEDPESEPILLTKRTEPLRIGRQGLSRSSSSSSVSTFMTDVTGYQSTSSME